MTQATPGEWETINQAHGSSHAIPESLHIRSKESAVFSVLAFIEATPQKFTFEIYLHFDYNNAIYNNSAKSQKSRVHTSEARKKGENDIGVLLGTKLQSLTAILSATTTWALTFVLGN